LDVHYFADTTSGAVEYGSWWRWCPVKAAVQCLIGRVPWRIYVTHELMVVFNPCTKRARMRLFENLNKAKAGVMVMLVAGFLLLAWGVVSIIETYKHRYADIVLTSGWVCIAAGSVITVLCLILLQRAAMEII
jgi:hypothetical protein